VSAPTLLLADAAPKLNVQVGQVYFKENGRIDEKIAAACNVEKNLRDSIATLNAIALRKQATARRQSPADAERRVDVRIDKLAPIGWSGPTSNSAGTELGVTALLSDQGVEQLFLCRASWKSRMVSPTQCSRVDYCADKIANDIAKWLGALPPLTIPRRR